MVQALLDPDILARLDRLQFLSRKIFRGRMQGEQRSRRRGHGVEFADFRSYVPGDDLRFVDWNLYARMERLFLKLFLEEEELHFHALIDDSRSMEFGSPSKLWRARQIAAALGYIGLCRGDRVKLESFSTPARATTPVLRGRRSLPRLLRHAETMTVADRVPLETAVRRFCLRNRGTGIVVVLSDLLDKDGYASAFRQLLTRHFDIYVIQLLSPEEIAPPLLGDLRLVDSEDADQAEITAQAWLLEQYRRHLASYVAEIHGFCTARGITHVQVDSSLSLASLLTTVFWRHGLVHD